MLVAVHGLAVRLRERCRKSPLTELLKPDGCRAPPRSSHRGAGARYHQRLARASGEYIELTRALTELLKPDGCLAPPRISHRAAGARHHQRLARASGEQLS